MSDQWLPDGDLGDDEDLTDTDTQLADAEADMRAAEFEFGDDEQIA